jgi:hypothetical protein
MGDIEFAPILEQTHRDNIVAATEKFNAVYGNVIGMEEKGQDYANTKGAHLNDAAINSFFRNKKGPWPVDCFGAANIIMAKGLIDTLPKNIRFTLPKDKTKIEPHIGYLNYWTFLPWEPISMMKLSFYPLLNGYEMKVGDWGYIRNNTGYFTVCPKGYYMGQNVIKLADKIYYGFSIPKDAGKKDLKPWLQILADSYNLCLKKTTIQRLNKSSN